LNLPHLEAAPPTGNPGPNPQGTPLSSANVGPNVPVAMQVPSCRLVGNRLDNFALNDLDGRPWQFRYRHGRLVLLDFWGTWCRPCVAAIPHLINLQRTYGAYGLEVVGIACEHSQGPDAAQRIRQMQNRLGINYRLLLTDSGDRCPVQAQFRVDHYPTLVLLDSDGQLLWRAEGADRFAELETTIRHHLRR
jgi:thiol-disulfide isomerase/thioredoxin